MNFIRATLSLSILLLSFQLNAASFSAGFSLSNYGKGLSGQAMYTVWTSEDSEYSCRALGSASLSTIENSHVNMKSTEFETALNFRAGAGLALYKHYDLNSIFVKILANRLTPDKHISSHASPGASVSSGMFIPLNKVKTGGFTLEYQTHFGHERARFIQNQPDLFNQSSVILGFEVRMAGI